MDKKTLFRKLDEGVSALRNLLAENEGSTLKTIVSSAKQGVADLKSALDGNEKAQKAIAEIKAHVEELEESIKAGDKKLSAKILAAAETKLKQYQKKYEKEPGKKTDGKAAAKPVKITAAKPKAAARTAKPGTTGKTAAAKDASGGNAAPKTAGKTKAAATGKKSSSKAAAPAAPKTSA